MTLEPRPRGAEPGAVARVDVLDSSDGPNLDCAPAVVGPDDPERYEQVGEHARGGLGRVVHAVDKRLGRTVAVKELLRRGPAAEARFLREAMITARLQHPGIVPVHEAGRWPSGDPYYVMKLVEGRTLKELIAERPTMRERLGLLPHLIAVADAVGYAHSEGVIHRDLKPANIMVGAFGETIVVDWGLARDQVRDVPEPTPEVLAGGSGTGPASATIDGRVIGTPAYMAPEQARGEPVDERADVYALDGAAVVTAGTLGEVMLWPLVGGAPRTLHRTIRVWDIATGRHRVLRGPSAAVDVVRWRDPGHLVSGARDGSLRMWEVPSLELPSAAALRAQLAAATSAVITRDRPTTLDGGATPL